MNVSLMQIIAALVMVGVATGLFFAYRTYLATNSERRMRAMLESVGLDPALAESGEIPTIMQEVRQRCRTCKSEDVCERWLKGNKKAPNDFCPNARVFEMLEGHSDAA